jgi:hypothetical protein
MDHDSSTGKKNGEVLAQAIIVEEFNPMARRAGTASWIKALLSRIRHSDPLDK